MREESFLLRLPKWRQTFSGLATRTILNGIATRCKRGGGRREREKGSIFLESFCREKSRISSLPPYFQRSDHLHVNFCSRVYSSIVRSATCTRTSHVLLHSLLKKT